MTRILLFLALLVGAWFAYRTLAGTQAGAASREETQGLHGLEALSHELPAEATGAEPPRPEPSATPAPANPALADLEARLAAGDRRGAAAKVVELAPDQAADPGFRRLAALSVRQTLASGDPEGAATGATALLDRWSAGPACGPQAVAELEEWQKLLRETMNSLLFNPSVAWRSRTYQVASGDNLATICAGILKRDAVRIEPGFLAAVNRVPVDKIKAGKRLRVPIGTMKVVVEKSSFTLKLFLDDVLIRIYRVGLGKGGCTPSALFKVKLKQAKPVWYPPGGQPVPHGHPNNPLGDHFIALESPQHQGFGIHGTRAEDRPTIGTLSSEGCIRMYAEDVAELFAFLPVGTEVVVR